jgi:DNA-binding NarL/FixJ family response regulator
LFDPEAGSITVDECLKQAEFIRILIVDDHPAMRLGLRALLKKVPDFCVVGESATGSAAIILSRETRPDIVLMDIDLPDISGIEAIQQIVTDLPDVRVLGFSNYSENQTVYKAIRAGATGYLLKIDAIETIVSAIRETHQGVPYFSKRAGTELIYQIQSRKNLAVPQVNLTPQEKVILDMLAEGDTDPMIAERLFVSPGTIRTHVSNILKKLGLKTRSQLVIYALQKKQEN